ncbi:hypothetical protein GCM10007276_34330 [Agaricicola taiwanensis]|uniref:Uncharacterized protein n=1 Tax=Agaricicola taiwanensis TaxID=591372 RepID=A0A8J3DZ41_9RHOB|nr:hypothetical protein [Agaricicola taiwanensis]GGE54375.1 hypothetical protein GCM10007276_34330 [Agaricicola taiwanensis]
MIASTNRTYNPRLWAWSAALLVTLGFYAWRALYLSQTVAAGRLSDIGWWRLEMAEFSLAALPALGLLVLVFHILIRATVAAAGRLKPAWHWRAKRQPHLWHAELVALGVAVVLGTCFIILLAGDDVMRDEFFDEATGELRLVATLVMLLSAISTSAVVLVPIGYLLTGFARGIAGMFGRQSARNHSS